MAGAEPPQMQVGDLVALAFDCPLHLLGHGTVRHAIEQDGAGIADEPDRPARDDERADKACQRVHPDPAELARQQQADDHQHRDRSVSRDMDDGGAHIVVAVMRFMSGVLGVILSVIVVVIIFVRMIMVVSMPMRMTMVVSMTVMMAASQKPGAGDI